MTCTSREGSVGMDATPPMILAEILNLGFQEEAKSFGCVGLFHASVLARQHDLVCCWFGAKRTLNGDAHPDRGVGRLQPYMLKP